MSQLPPANQECREDPSQASNTYSAPVASGESKAIVVIAVELPATGGFGRVRMGCVPDTSARSLTHFVGLSTSTTT
jgi:hypothetical protein